MTKQVALGFLPLGPEDLVQVGDLERVATGQDQCSVLARLFEVVELGNKGVDVGPLEGLLARRSLGEGGRACLPAGALAKVGGLEGSTAGRQDVIAQPQIRWMAQPALVSHLRIADLRHEDGPGPMRRVVLGRSLERAGRGFDATQERHQPL